MTKKNEVGIEKRVKIQVHHEQEKSQVDIAKTVKCCVDVYNTLFNDSLRPVHIKIDLEQAANALPQIVKTEY
ncbi:unnamed protein product [Acanthoscelides obtectus]|uniref:Uncharacterized protein n=1 Tax=Acanthoscelides obtectus TaxID=200917 RepID=A0A9P0K9K9_ACAOB|nr:unnamed protein product [Acanthoscelides obtectus]CAK1662511.1 hypothetical protein AOBTE_LOCUS23188 [Acanthoscelides obtectus]